DVLDVRQRAGLEVVHADHAVPARQQLIAQVGTQKAGAAGDNAGGHSRRITARPEPAARSRTMSSRAKRSGTAAARRGPHSARASPNGAAASAGEPRGGRE